MSSAPLGRLATSLWPLPIAVLMVSLGTGCSNPERARALALSEKCSRNSDCEIPLVCAFEHCHEQCRADRDCEDGTECVRYGDSELRVCKRPQEAEARDAAREPTQTELPSANPDSGLASSAASSAGGWCEAYEAPPQADCTRPLVHIHGSTTTDMALAQFTGEVIAGSTGPSIEQIHFEIYNGSEYSAECVPTLDGFSFEVALSPSQSKVVEIHPYEGGCEMSTPLEFVLLVNDAFITEPAFPEDPLNVSKVFSVLRDDS